MYCLKFVLFVSLLTFNMCQCVAPVHFDSERWEENRKVYKHYTSFNKLPHLTHLDDADSDVYITTFANSKLHTIVCAVLPQHLRFVQVHQRSLNGLSIMLRIYICFPMLASCRHSGCRAYDCRLEFVHGSIVVYYVFAREVLWVEFVHIITYARAGAYISTNNCSTHK